MSYLYGASVQGIQEFIFATNKLSEIVGASEIVKGIDKKINEYNKCGVLVSAARNIKAIFHDKELIEKVVLEFPKKIMQEAYGITISQAVVKLKTDKYTQEDINELERRLKIQRNKPTSLLDPNINILKPYSRTARPLVSQNEDVAISQKHKAYTKYFKENSKERKFKEIAELSNNKNKIAIIHADGNGLGQLIPHLKSKTRLDLSEFSEKLDEATKEAFEKASSNIKKIRKLILSGDDMVAICDANEALSFTKNFLYHFEKETKKLLKYKLTACAGIAYCNEKYPFHYAVNLAEELCSQTKKHAKKINEELAPSSLMFHNIQSSNYQSWDKFIEDELTITNDKETIRLDFGPYYLDEPNQPTIENFQNTVEAYRCDVSPISKLRDWLGSLGKSSQYAKNQLNRINEVTKLSQEWNSCIMEKNLKAFNKELSNDQLIVQKDGYNKTPIYDVLQILSVTEAV